MLSFIFAVFMGLMPVPTHQTTAPTQQAMSVPCTGPGCYGSDPRCDTAPDACH